MKDPSEDVYLTKTLGCDFFAHGQNISRGVAKQAYSQGKFGVNFQFSAETRVSTM
jgi:hypothetical protein